MNGAPHRQGSSSFTRYKQILEEKNKKPMSDMDALFISKRGSDRAHQFMEKYSEVAKEKHGSDYDVMKEALDPVVVYMAGGGKKHGRHFIGDGYIDSRVRTSQSRSMCSQFDDDGFPLRRVCPRVDRMSQLENQLAEMRQLLLSIQTRLPQESNAAVTTPTPIGTPIATPETRHSVQCNPNPCDDGHTPENMAETNENDHEVNENRDEMDHDVVM